MLPYIDGLVQERHQHIPITMSTQVDKTTVADEERNWLKAITQDDGDLARSILSGMAQPRLDLMLQYRDVLSPGVLKHVQCQCVLTASSYIPDNAWCLAALFNAHKVLNAMREYGVSARQKSSHGNTFLHCIIAYASTQGEERETKCKKTIIFMRSLMTDDEYRDVFLAENEDGVRPLELASHLGTFILFQFLFDTNQIYLKKTQELAFYTVHYHDITEYITGNRFARSPLHGMMLLDYKNLNDKSTNILFQTDPMLTWFTAVAYSNSPFIVLNALMQLITIISRITSLAIIDMKEKLVTQQNSDNVTNGTTIHTYNNSPADTVLLCLLLYNVCQALLSIMFTLATVIFLKMNTKSKWVYRTVSGPKTLVVQTKINTLSSLTSSICIAVMSILFIKEHFEEGGFVIVSSFVHGMVLLVALAGVWDVLYFVQLIPGLSLYVVAVQRMLLDLASFSIIMALFFASYAFTFHLLSEGPVGIQSTMYNTFRLMLNMFSFPDEESTLQVFHVIFIFLLVYLLWNIVIAIFSSTFEHIRKHKEVIARVQALSVTLMFQDMLPTLLQPIRNHLLKKYLIFEDGNIYVTKVVMKPVHGESLGADAS